jgi:hypothetical protein
MIVLRRMAPAVEIWCGAQGPAVCLRERRCVAAEIDPSFRPSCCSEPAVSTPPSCDTFQLGVAYVDGEGMRVQRPMDFSRRNRMTLTDLQRLHVMLFRPDLPEGAPGLGLDESDRMWLIEVMVRRSQTTPSSLLVDSRSIWTVPAHTISD